jgi:hypothetical protein
MQLSYPQTMKPLSIKASDQEIEIRASKGDYAAALVGALIGAAPVLGPLAAEVITSTIPNQKMDRVVLFIGLLEDKLKYLEQDVLEQKVKTEEFTDLLEDALSLASRALTRERRRHIANLLKNSLTNEELDHLGKKKLLAILDRLNDAEVKLLYYYSLENREKIFEMQDRNPYINKIVNRELSRTTDAHDEVLYGSYRRTLITDQLINPESTTIDRITGLGNLLLKFIDPIYE